MNYSKELPETLAGNLDHVELVRSWERDLQDSWAAYLEQEQPEDAYSVLTLVGKLRRCKPELITETVQKIACDMIGEIHEMTKKSLLLISPQNWLEQAKELAEKAHHIPRLAWIDWASQLLDELDDGEIILYWAYMTGQVTPQLERGIADAHQFLMERERVFWVATLYIQDIGMTIREDLPSYDLSLTGTAEKWATLLDSLYTYYLNSKDSVYGGEI